MNTQIVSIKLVKEKTFKYQIPVNSPERSYAVAREILADLDKETLIVLCLNTRNKINAVNVVSTGTINSSLANPREIFKAAILSNSVAVVLAHNHPSGDCSPSRDDISVTRQIIQAGRILEIEVLDHIIVGEGHYWSMKEDRGDLFK